MGSDATARTAEIWAYVHGQMDPSARRAMEEAMASDQDLAAEVRRTQEFDAQLRAHLPATGRPADELADQILAAFEREGLRIVSPFPSHPSHKSHRVRLEWAVGAISAAAACLLICAGLDWAGSTPLRWNQPDFVSAAYRGVNPAFTPADAATCLTALKRSVDRHARSVPGAWDLACRFYDTGHGGFALQVQALRQSDGTSRVWTFYHDSVASFLLASGQLGRQIAAVLSGEP